MNLEGVGKCIKRNREKKKLTIAELAQMAGLEVTALEECEAGIRKPDLKELRGISTAIGVPILMLMHGGGTRHRSEIDENGHRICRWEEW